MPDGNELVPAVQKAEPKITFTRDYSVAVPRGERAYMIPASEWDRIKRMVARITPSKNWFVVAASICAGMCVSAVFCLIGFASSWDKVPTWAKATATSFALCALVLCAALFYLDSQQRADIKESTDDVTNEMNQLEHSCQANDEAVGNSPASAVQN